MQKEPSAAQKLEYELYEKAQQLAELRRQEPAQEVQDYPLQTIDGPTTLSALFAGQERLLAIHNMGQACRYCTLWADGLNGVLDHLENAFSVVLLSKDSPAEQRRMALDRGWRFRTASHGGGDYMTEQSVMQGNMPGAVVYELRDEVIYRRGSALFGPGDLYSPVWHLLALAGIGNDNWTPQYHYWRRPEKLEDGGENIVD